MSKQKPYRVWFDQVNPTMFDVKASSMDNAIEKARREWKDAHTEPTGTYAEEVKE